MNHYLKSYIYFLFLFSLILASNIEASSQHKITCGNGKTISVSDSQVKQAVQACLSAGYPAPKKTTAPTAKMRSQLSQQQAKDDCKYDPNSARLPDCKNKLKKKDGCKYDPNSAKLPCSDARTSGLLLPAVQAVQTNKEVGRGLNCGASKWITKALKQCGKKRYSYALCNKQNGFWSCIPSRNKTNPKVRATGFSQTK